jgi:hypothetical protein
MNDLVLDHQVDRAAVMRLEAEMLKTPQIELEVVHYFSKGVYARELHIPKGITLTGKIHKYENLNILSKGELSVLVDGEIVRISAPFTVVSPPGTKRVAYAHEDCIWTTIHGTEKRDVDMIEVEFIAQSEAEYLSFAEALKLGST